MPAHQSITDPTKIHEAKQIASATTADAGKVITPSSVTNGVGSLRKLAVDELDPDGRTPWTGWAQYSDNEYTSVSKRSIAASTKTKVTINGLGARTNVAGLPAGVVALWDTNNDLLIPAEENDAYDVRFTCKGSLDASGSDKYVDFELDIGGSIGVVTADTKPFIKDTAPHNFTFCFPIFAAATFLTNGGTIYITPNANASFWDFEILIVRTHRGA